MRRAIFFIMLLSLLGGCAAESDSGNGDGATSNPTSPDPTYYSISGYIQKGPFVSGSSITIQELDADLEPTGVSYQTTTIDDLGTFSLGSQIGTEHVEIIATGYYYNEVSGEISPSTLTLRSISKLSDAASCNVNILTTLQKPRLKQLVLSGMDFTAAREQAAAEILSIFKIEGISDAFDSMDLTELGEKNKILLAVSAILQGDRSVGELSELVSKINLDIEYDGSLDSTTIIDSIKSTSATLSPSQIKSNLQDRFGNLGVSVEIGTFEDYIDSDGDGVINKNDDNDPDALTFNSVSSASLDTAYTSNQQTIAGLADNSYTTATFTGSAKVNGAAAAQTVNVKNGDTIEFTVQSSPKYNTAVSASVTINGQTHTYTVTTIQDTRPSITIFSSGVKTDGDFLSGESNYHNDLCESERLAKSIPGTTALGLISRPGGPKMADLVTYDSVNPRVVVSENGSIIRSDGWYPMFPYNLHQTLSDAGVISSADKWWSGTAKDAVVSTKLDDRDCSGWTDNSAGVFGSVGVPTLGVTNSWYSAAGLDGQLSCDQQAVLLCVAY